MRSNHLAKSLVFVLGMAMAACGGGGGGSTPSDPGPTTYTLTVAKSGVGTGTVTGPGVQCGDDCSTTQNSGTKVTLLASASTGSTFTGWSGDCSGTSTSCVVTMASNKAATANFGSLGNALTIVRAGTGSGSVASTSTATSISPASGIDCGLVCLAYYPSGSVTLTATPAVGATFTGWTGGGCSGTGECVVAMTAAQTVTATFDGGDTYASRSAGCNNAPSSTLSSMMNTGTPIAIQAGGLQRRYILSVPTTYDNTRPYRLVIAFHEMNGNDKKMYANGYYHLQNLSGDSTIFVAPNGQLFNISTGTAPKTPCTGNGIGDGNCGWPNPDGTDIALADAVVAEVAANFCIDMSHIFVTGWSFGGSMSYETACERPAGGSGPWSVRGVAAYSAAQVSGSCSPTKPVAYYQSHGDHDSTLPYDRGLEIFQKAATANGCQYATPTKVTSGNHVCTTLSGCTTGDPTVFCSFNGDHTPDPIDPNTTTSWQYQAVWNFFRQL